MAGLKSTNKLQLWFFAKGDGVEFLSEIVSKCHLWPFSSSPNKVGKNSQRENKSPDRRKHKTKLGIATVFQSRIISVTQACWVSGHLLRLSLIGYLGFWGGSGGSGGFFALFCFIF